MSQAHKRADKNLYQKERKLDNYYKKSSKQIDKLITDFYKLHQEEFESNLKKYQSGEITKDEYRKYMSQMTITSFEWQQLIEKITDMIATINQRALTNIVNDDLEKIYIDNYNTTIRAIGGDLTEN